MYTNIILAAAEETAKHDNVWGPLITAGSALLMALAGVFTGFGRWIFNRFKKYEDAQEKREKDCEKNVNDVKLQNAELVEFTKNTLVTTVQQNTTALSGLKQSLEDSQLSQRQIMGMLGDMRREFRGEKKPQQKPVQKPVPGKGQQQ